MIMTAQIATETKHPSIFAISVVFGGGLGMGISTSLGLSGEIGFLFGSVFLFLLLAVPVFILREIKAAQKSLPIRDEDQDTPLQNHLRIRPNESKDTQAQPNTLSVIVTDSNGNIVEVSARSDPLSEKEIAVLKTMENDASIKEAFVKMIRAQVKSLSLSS
jgi:hypothetical protein